MLRSGLSGMAPRLLIYPRIARVRAAYAPGQSTQAAAPARL